jgi:hypothetical protein
MTKDEHIAYKTSRNKLYEEFTVMALTAFDAENRFKAMACKGGKKRGLVQRLLM